MAMSSKTDGSRSENGRDSPRCYLPAQYPSAERGITSRSDDNKDSGSKDRSLATEAASCCSRPSYARAGFSPARSPNRSASAMFPPPLPKGADGYEKAEGRCKTELSSSPRPLGKRSAPPHSLLDRAESLRSDMSDTDGDSGSITDRDARNGILALETLDPPSMSHGDFICLCTPAPKIPRPRNAFILFRQHYQAHVVAENPGLTNPDISKIIGRMWQKQSKDVKEDWKKLAEKEKARHRIQYPDYRYQPRRVGKGTSANGSRLSLAGGYGSEGACGNSAANGEPDPSRCPKCGGRYIATPRTPSTPRYALGSAKRQSTPASAFGIFHTSEGKSDGTGSGGHPLSANFEAERNYRHGLASPGPSQYSNSTLLSRNYQREIVRRPLPQHGCQISAGESDGGGGGANAGGGAVAGYIDDMPPDQKRRRYDLPLAPPAHSANSNVFVSYRPAPHQHYPGTPLPMTPATAPLPSYHRSPQAWMDLPPPPPPRLSARYHTNTFSSDARGGRSTPEVAQAGGRLPHQYPASSSMASFPSASAHRPAPQIQRTPVESRFAVSIARRPGEVAPGREYTPPSARLPPPGTSYGYYQLTGSADNTQPPPSTAMERLSMTAATPRFVAPMAEPLPDAGSVVHRHRQAQSGIADDSLKLPPLQTHMLPKAQSPSRSDSGSGGGGNNRSRGSVPLSHAVTQSGFFADDNMAADSGRDSAVSGRMQDMHSFAIQPTPIEEHGQADRDNQASGIRAMVMSVPYLNKLEVLRRISPPQAALSKRGPVIAVEGHSTALIVEVGCIIEKALVQSDECAVGVWSTLADRGLDKSNGRGGDRDDDNDDGRDNSSDALSAYHQFIMSWHKKSQEIVRHTTARSKPVLAPTPSSSSSATPQPEVMKKGPALAAVILADRAAESPPAPPSPASSSSLSATSSPEQSPQTPTAQPRPPPPPPAARLPVALITGGYSLSISDYYATSVPIEDGFPPIGHWEWMATLWRGTAGPDLVVYADPKPPSKPMDSAVNPYAQEGVMVFHVPPKTEPASQDGPGKKLVDDKSSRRLAFEVMEWVRTTGFCED